MESVWHKTKKQLRYFHSYAIKSGLDGILSSRSKKRMLFCWSLWKKSETDFEELGETLGRFSTTFPPFVSPLPLSQPAFSKRRPGIFDQVCVLNLAEIFVHPEPPSSLFYLLSHQGKPYTKDLSSWLAANFLAKHFVFTFSQNQIPTFMSAAHPWSLPCDSEKGGGSRSGAV